MHSELTASDIRDMIVDRVILLSDSQKDDTVSDEIIGMLTALHDRTIMNTDKISDVKYTTSIGTKVREREYSSGNVDVTLSSYIDKKAKEGKK